MSAHFSTQPRLAIFFQLDPLNPTIGGIQTCIKYIIKYAPARLRIQLVGIAQGRRGGDAGVGRWQTVELYGRQFDFLPLLNVADDNVRSLVPTTVKYALALRKYLKKHPPSSKIYQADFYQFHRIEPTLFTSPLGGTKLLYIHNDIHQEVKGVKAKGGILWKRAPWAYFALERKLVRQFDRILSCNSRSAQLYQQQYPDIAQRVSYLPNTFDSDLFYPLSRSEKDAARRQLAQKLNLPKSTRFILFAGRLHPQKRPDLLIQSMAALTDAAGRPLENVHLLVVGKGELTADVQAEIARLNQSSRVSLLPPMSQAELAHLYQLSELFVLTSAYEGLARGSLEALACGTPVVTTRAGETPNFLTAQSGIVCEELARDQMPRAIAQAWQQVLDHPANYPASACRQVAQPYDAALVVSALYGDLLQSLAAESSRLQPEVVTVG